MTKTMAEVLAEHQNWEYLGNLGYYRSEYRCQCFGTFWYGDHEEDPTFSQALSDHQSAALAAAGYGLVADAKREAWAELVASSPRLPNAVRNVVFEAVFDVVDKFNFPAQNMSNLPDVVEIGDVCGDVEKRIVAIIRAAEMRQG